MIETHKPHPVYQSVPIPDNSILSRTLADEPMNEKLIRGLQALDVSHKRLVDVTTRMIETGNRYCDTVDELKDWYR